VAAEYSGKNRPFVTRSFVTPRNWPWPSPQQVILHSRRRSPCFFAKLIRGMLSRLLTFLTRLIRTNAFGMPAA
jgi:hypothetical protein